MTCRGFTLAEVLITLGIIGVVAALTIPTLMQEQKEKAAVAAVKKHTAMISNAVKMAIANDGVFSGEDVKAWYDYISPYLNVQEYCGEENGCWVNDTLKTLGGSDWINMYNTDRHYQKAVLSDGSSLQTWTSADTDIAEFRIDYNGAKGPNTVGIDIFYFQIFKKDGKLNLKRGNDNENPDVAVDIYPCKRLDTSVGVGDILSNGMGCTSWVFFNENMDYLHCDDLSWDGKTKCD